MNCDKCLLFAFNLLIILLALAEIGNGENNIKDPYSQLYIEKPAKTPAETFELLKSLFEIYKQKKESQKSFDIGQLLWSGEFDNENHCRRGYFYDLKCITEENSKDSKNQLNVMPYLEYCKREQLAYCTRDFNNYVKNIVDAQFSAGQKQSMMMLKNEIAKADKSDAQKPVDQINYTSFVMGLKSYLKLKYSELNLKSISKERIARNALIRKWAEYIEDLVCYPIREKFDFVLFAMDEIPERLEPNDLTLEWIRNAKLCKIIHAQQADMEDDVFALLYRPMRYKLKQKWTRFEKLIKT